jgi:hypothetical protein
VLLQRAAERSPGDAKALTAYAEFLDRHGDPYARQAYDRALNALPKTGNELRAAILRRLVALDLLADDQASAKKHVEEYRAAGGTGITSPASGPPASDQTFIEIPGPLRSFARMAALSPDLPGEDLLPALARNIVTNGYQAANSNEALEQTEYLKLVVRYLSQARELEKLGGTAKTISIPSCETTEAADLLRVLGFRMRGGCGSEVVLETVNASRAFLTIDSGFPVAELEQALRTNRPFTYEFQPTRIPILYGAEYWLSSSRDKQSTEFIDAFIADPSLCRLYLGMSKLDRETAEELRKAVPAQRLKALAHVLDFYGAMYQIRGGKAIVPGGSRSASAWADLVGASPDQGAAFFERLLAKDDGWMGSYFDALSRIHGPVRDYLLEPERMKRFYLALRGKVTSPGPARPVFRSNTDLMLLTTRLRLEPDGKPHIPGGLDVWKNLFINHPHGKYDGKLTKAANGWKEPDDVIEALFALCRKTVENEPLKIFMALSDLNRLRAKPLEATTIDKLAREYRSLGAQYSILNESPLLADSTILAFIETAQAVSQIRDQGLRANTAGTFQGLVSLWQIFTRQGSIPGDRVDATLAGILQKFGRMRNSRELFDAGQSSVKLILKATGSPENVRVQDRLVNLLAGAGNPADADSHTQVVQDMIRVFEAQRLVSLQLLFDLADHLESLASGGKLDTALVNRLAARLSELQLPRAAMSTVERNAFAFGYWTDRHIEAQRKLNLRALVEKSLNDPEKLREARGHLAPFLRDTLVGFSYMHYAPPGAQVLYTNPLFVRGHDFLGVQGSSQTWRATEVFGTGWPSSAGGRLVGSLAGLPYALAEAEQNFLIPSREQALIWGDLVPQMIISAKVPRWWNASPAQLHWIGLHMRLGEALVAEGALNPDDRKQVVQLLERHAPPARVNKIENLLVEGRVRQALEHITPAELFLLACDSRKDSPLKLAEEIRQLAAAQPEVLSDDAISNAFGTPKPTLANSYRPQLLNLRTFPTLMGYSSRIMAESWESSMLYYAALADEVYLTPSQLNVTVPEWTQRTVERIFATHLEDWPALLRSLRLVGDEVRQRARAQMATEQKASLE